MVLFNVISFNCFSTLGYMQVHIILWIRYLRGIHFLLFLGYLRAQNRGEYQVVRCVLPYYHVLPFPKS